MASWMTRALLVATVGFGMGAPVAMAQESTNRVATMTDWSVFAEENPKECWGVSSPKETVNTKDGKPVAALVDARLFERIRRMQARFDALCQRIEAGYSGVAEEIGMAEIDAAIAEDRRGQACRTAG